MDESWVNHKNAIQISKTTAGIKAFTLSHKKILFTAI